MKNKIVKAISSILISSLMYIPMTANAYTAPIDLAVNGSIIKTDQDPYIENGTTFVPVRFLSEAVGAYVSWDGENVLIDTTDTSIKLTIGSKNVYVNGKKQLLSSAAHIKNDRTYIPVRNICEMLGAEVSWLDGYHIVYITADNCSVDKKYVDTSYTLDEIFWLGRIIEAESGGESKTGKIAVGNVILNRVKSEEYPDTIYGVIFDKKFGTQFQPVSNGTIYNTPSSESLQSAKLALSGVNTVGESLYFLNPSIATSFWITSNRAYYTTIGNHDFYL